MPNFTALTTEDTYRRFFVALDNAIAFDDRDAADGFCETYEAFLKENPSFAKDEPEWFKKYEILYHKAMWVALPYLLDESDIVELFKNWPQLLREMTEYNLEEAIRRRLRADPVEARDALRAKMRDALTQSPSVGPLVRAWLEFMGANSGDALLQARFWNENKLFASQPEDNKEYLKKLLTTFDYLRLSSMSDKGFEQERLYEMDGKLVNFSRGNVDDLDPEMLELTKKILALDSVSSPSVGGGGAGGGSRSGTIPPPPSPLQAGGRKPDGPETQTLNKLRTRFADPPVLASAIKQKMAAFEQVASADPKRIAQAVTDAIVPPTSGKPSETDVTAALRAYARLARFEDVLHLPKLMDVVARYYESKGRKQDAQDVKTFPEAPKHLVNFLRATFEVVLGLSEDSSARHTLQIANILKRKGDDILMKAAVYDEAKDAFVFVSS